MLSTSSASELAASVATVEARQPLTTTKSTATASAPTASSQSPAQAQSQPTTPRHRCRNPVPYLILTNISKRQNVRNILQIAAAYGCPQVFVVGQRALNFDPEAEGSDVPRMIQGGVREGLMTIVRFEKLEECVRHIKGMSCCEEMPALGKAVKASMTQAEGGGCDRAEDSGESHKDGAGTDGNDEIMADGCVPILGVEIDPSSINLEKEPFQTSTAFMMGNEGSGMTKKQMSVCDGFIRIAQYGGGTASLNVSVAAGLVFHRFFHWARGDDVKGRVCGA